MLKFTKVCLYYWLYAMKNDEKNDENKMEVMKLYMQCKKYNNKMQGYCVILLAVQV